MLPHFKKYINFFSVFEMFPNKVSCLIIYKTTGYDSVATNFLRVAIVVQMHK